MQVGHAVDPAKMLMVTGDQLATALAVARKPSLGWVADGAACIDLDKVECNHAGTVDGEQCKQCPEDFKKRLLDRAFFIQPGSVLAVGPWVMQMVTAEKEMAGAQQERIKSELMKLCNRAGAVIFYRMQPDFKAEIAKLTRRYPFQLRNIRFIK